jgi:RNA polymerase sigma factor (sigma-70 family)
MANLQSATVAQQPGAPTDSVGDGQLLARFVAQRDELAELAFGTLVRRHGPMVLHVCRQVLGDYHAAEDAFQATFLILARRAGSLRRPELLWNWLYGVALRTAREVRMREHRRRRREKPATEGRGEPPSDGAERPDATLACREEFAALHEEVCRLPETERAAVVLCSLEGLTYQEAALRLCCPVGTIGVRFSRARERLRLRLTRRGLAPSAALLGALFGAETARAAMPSALVGSTIEAAAAFVSGGATTTGLVSTQGVALAQAVLRAIGLRQLKTAGLLAVTVGVAVSLVGFSVARHVPIPVAPMRVKSEPTVQKPADPTPRAQATVRPGVEAPHPGEPTAPMLADRKSVDAGPKSDVGQSARKERALGEALFVKEWVPNDPASHGGDGLGPVYNETSCMACHGLGAPGVAGPASKNVVILTASPKKRDPAPILEQLHPGFRDARSTVVHRFGTDPAYASWRRQFYGSSGDDAPINPAARNEDSVDARARALREESTPDGRLRDRTLRLKSTKDFVFMLSERNPPALFGAGRIDAIPSEALVKLAEQQPKKVQGRVNRTAKGNVGLFGWKAQIASLHEFVRAACANELGLEVPGHHQAIAPLSPKEPAKGLDLSDIECDAMVAYIRALPAPVVIDSEGLGGTFDVQEGRRLFSEVGCTSCHIPSLGDIEGIYGDLLLHDMGNSLSDTGSSYGADEPTSPGGPTPNEWRTPPLWGYRDSGPYLHDGRAETLDQAVAFHEAQGSAARHEFFALSDKERARIESFLKSLIAPPATAIAAVTLGSPKEQSASETDIRRGRAGSLARDEQMWQDDLQRRQTDADGKLARARMAAAAELERMNKFEGALEFYRKIVRQTPDSEEGRLAARRIAALSQQAVDP